MQPRNRAARPRKQWVTLTDAFRQLVCAAYPRRPQLADEIQSYRWFTHPSERLEIFHCPYCAPQEELQAAKAALDALKRGVRQEEIRLRGCLSNRLSKPRKDIDSTEARDGELNIFDRVLEVSEGGGVVRKYQQVDCLANDIRRIARTFNAMATGVFQVRRRSQKRPPRISLRSNFRRCPTRRLMPCAPQQGVAATAPSLTGHIRITCRN